MALHEFPCTNFIAVVMILRVYAMWSQSKRILYTLLFIHVSQIIITFVWDGAYTNPDNISGMSRAQWQGTLEHMVPQ